MGRRLLSVRQADYYPFGNQRQVFTSSVNNPYQFTGYEYDSDTQQDYAVARFEAGKWGRFLSPDPFMGSMDVSNPESLNRYSYVLNNPLNLIDPLGLCGESHATGETDPPQPCITLPADCAGPPTPVPEWAQSGETFAMTCPSSTDAGVANGNIPYAPEEKAYTSSATANPL